MRTFLKYNGLSIVLLSIFSATLIGQYITGWKVYSENELLHGVPVALTEYFTEPHFIEALFENWESEFLQMAAYVIFTVFLFQKGSSESKRPDVTERVDIIPSVSASKNDSPWPVRRGGWIKKVYANSLSLALLFLFGLSFVFHAIGGARQFNSDQIQHGQPTVSSLEYVGTSQFWFESFQNWQSEFLSIAVMVISTIFLRQQGSPESKPVDSPHSSTGID